MPTRDIPAEIRRLIRAAHAAHPAGLTLAQLDAQLDWPTAATGEPEPARGQIPWEAGMADIHAALAATSRRDGQGVFRPR